MADITLASLSENFFPVTSSYLLAQPEPQYLYGQMYLSALQTELSPPSEDGLQIPGRVLDGAGAAYSPAERDRLAMASPLMSSVFVPKVEFQGQPGNLIRFNRPLFADTTYTEASREIGANTSISTTTINAGSEQVSLILKRFAGPYDQANSRVAPYGIDALAAQVGVHKLASFVGTHLKRDFHKTLDSFVVTLLDTASVVVRPSGMTADNDATVANQYRLDLETVVRAEYTADAANLPTFPDGSRLLVITPKQVADLRQDADFIELSKVHPEMNLLFPNYVSSVGKLHIFKSNTLNQANNSSSVPIHKGHLIAPGALLGGMGKPPRVAPSTDDNFGETAKVIWIAYLALGFADNRFAISVRSS
jgi:N4-gp56 family major capsid protein